MGKGVGKKKWKEGWEERGGNVVGEKKLRKCQNEKESVAWYAGTRLPTSLSVMG